jgi:mRNA interferase RelE/StbE
MANYKVVVEKRAEKEISKLDKKATGRIREAIDSLEIDPKPPSSKRLVGVEAYRLRVGDYRIIYEIAEKIVTIYVVKVGHRKDVYKK